MFDDSFHFSDIIVTQFGYNSLFNIQKTKNNK